MGTTLTADTVESCSRNGIEPLVCGESRDCGPYRLFMGSMQEYDIVVIGSGPGGQKAAIASAKLGKSVAIIERGRMLGGVCVNTGTIPSKTLREAVLYLTGMNQRELYGASYRVKDRITPADLLARTQHVIGKEIDVVRNQLMRNRIDLLIGHGRFLDPHTIVVEDPGRREMTTVTGEYVVIATGTRPARPSGVEFDEERVLDSDGILDLKSLPASMVVVGAGVIGIEYASMFAALGVEVTVIDGRERPLEFLDSEIVDELMHQMRKQNVTFRLGETVQSMEAQAGPAGPRAVLHLASGKRIVADVALFSVGRVGATDALALENAGLTADARGRIAVDEHFRTSVPHIFAAGDVIGYPSLAATSSEQGRLAACHALGGPAAPMAAHFPIGIYAVPEMSMVGATEGSLTKACVPYEVGVARYREIARGQILGDESGFFKMLFDRTDRRLLGVHIIGTGATELIHIGQAVLRLGGGLDYFLETVFNYPTLAECYKVAALSASNKLAE